MPADRTIFRTELVTDVSGEQPVRLIRMEFTAHELRTLCALLNAGVGATGYGFTARTISRHFIDAMKECRGTE